MAAIIHQFDKRIGVTYAYESISHWDKNKKQSRAARHLIGIVDAKTGVIIPTKGKNKLDKVTEDSEIACCKCNVRRTFYGVTYLLDCIGETIGIKNDLMICFPDTYKQILSIAYYLIMEDKNPLSRFSKWSMLHTHPWNKVIPSQRSSDLFAEMTENQRMHFFKLQAKRRIEMEYLAYDTTSISSYSQKLRQVRPGVNKDYDPLPQINLALLFGEESGLPFYYRKLPGNVTDVTTVKQLLKDMEFLGCNKIKLVMDRGFYSETNVNALYAEHLKFLIATKISLKYVKAEVDKIRDSIRIWKNYIPEDEVYGQTVLIHWKYKQKRPYIGDELEKDCRMYMHIYFSPDKALEDEKQLNKQLYEWRKEIETGQREKTYDSQYAKYFDIKTTPIRGQKITVKEEAIQEASKYYGFFVFLSNETSNAKQALSIYRNKDVVEKAFENVKDRLEMKRTGVSSDLSLDGKLFVEFIALIFLSYIHQIMQKSDLYKKYTMHELLDEIEIIERYDRPGSKTQVSEITTKQKDIFCAFGVQPPDSSLC